jgi:predicted TIM-barrel fold metal-dependent hydrolase
MIVDCHAHVFQDWQGPCGHATRALHLKYLQKNMTRPAAKVFRARDGERVDAGALSRPGANGWSGLTDVDFRVGANGQLDFTIDGEDFYVQYMPVGMQQMVAPPELMLAQMAYAGVDRCVLQAGGAYGAMNDYNAFAQHQYPDKFFALMNVDEGALDRPEVLRETERAFHVLGLRGLYYGLDGMARHDFGKPFTDPSFAAFWERIAAWKIPVFIEMAAIPNYDEASAIANVARLDALLTRYKDVRFLLVMGPPVGFFAKQGKWEFPDAVARTYRRDNLWLEIMYPISWGGVWDYPYPEAQALIRDLRDKLGAEKLVWGSDMPNVERFCTYTQSLDYVRRYCEFLTPREKDRILGDNVAELCGVAA